MGPRVRNKRGSGVRGERTVSRVCAGSLSANGCRIMTVTLYTTTSWVIIIFDTDGEV
jgi:hypothetical protein